MDRNPGAVAIAGEGLRGKGAQKPANAEEAYQHRPPNRMPQTILSIGFIGLSLGKVSELVQKDDKESSMRRVEQNY